MKDIMLPTNNVLIVPKGNKLLFIKSKDIMFIKALDNYCCLYLADKSRCTITKTLGSIEVYLKNQNFVRCHKSFIVNLDYIIEIVKGRLYNIILVNEEVIPISRRKSSMILRILNQSHPSTFHPENTTVHPIEMTVN